MPEARNPVPEHTFYRERTLSCRPPSGCHQEAWKTSVETQPCTFLPWCFRILMAGSSPQGLVTDCIYYLSLHRNVDTATDSVGYFKEKEKNEVCVFHYPPCHCQIKRRAKPTNPRHFFAPGGSGPFGGHASSHPVAVSVQSGWA